LTLVLGIHSGHDASCAIVADGALVAAVAQERITRAKHDGQEALSNKLPIQQCLHAAGASLQDVDVIVSSFQAASPGGIGLHRPLVEPDFDRFDPRTDKHFVISHHRAHAVGTLGCSGFSETAILVCDLGGSSTLDGCDFFRTFSEFEARVTSLMAPTPLQTESLSIYDATWSSLQLKHLEWCMPHNAPDVFMQSAASLYDNIARTVFKKDHAHGQLMALAAMSDRGEELSPVKSSEMFVVDGFGCLQLRNDWQHLIEPHSDVLANAPIAFAAQRALQAMLMHYARRARDLTARKKLAVSGGVFLNIPANSEIAQSGLFDEYYAPSAPHDAGIAVGCAYAGWQMLGNGKSWHKPHRSSDRLGPNYDNQILREALKARAPLLDVTDTPPVRQIAERLQKGQVIARFQGRSEFGPRALGGRSLLASPLLAASKQHLNAIKRRQDWRPVAPVVIKDRVHDFFAGPVDSPYMNFVQFVRNEHRAMLGALFHPDASTRVQTLDRPDDPALYALLVECGELTGYPILVNTSLNGPGEPIVETPADAITFFLSHPSVDALLLDQLLVTRTLKLFRGRVWFAPDTIVSILYPSAARHIILVRRNFSMEISAATFDWVQAQHEAPSGGDQNPVELIGEQIEREVFEAMCLGLLVQLAPCER
jgi:carbamoyltransferase